MAQGLRCFCRGVLWFLVLAAVAPSWASEDPGSPPAEAAVRTVRVLFIGNSFTYFNDLPSLFADFAEATYPNLEVVTESVTPSGESLKSHYLAAATIAATLFGDVRPAETVERPAAIPDGEARGILSALRSVREELAPTGGLADVPAPEFTPRPSLASSEPISDP